MASFRHKSIICTITTFFSACPFDQLSLDQLSDKEVLARQANVQRMGYLMFLLLVLFAGVAFALSSYLVTAGGWALIPALGDYSKKRKAIKRQLQKRNLA